MVNHGYMVNGHEVHHEGKLNTHAFNFNGWIPNKQVKMDGDSKKETQTATKEASK